MPEKKVTHVHKLKRLRYKSGNIIFFCTLPDCKFKSSAPLLLGKRAICWRCGDEFLMGDYALRLAKPHCENCHQSKEVKPVNDGPVDILDAIKGLAVSEQRLDNLQIPDEDDL